MSNLRSSPKTTKLWHLSQKQLQRMFYLVTSMKMRDRTSLMPCFPILPYLGRSSLPREMKETTFTLLIRYATLQYYITYYQCSLNKFLNKTLLKDSSFCRCSMFSAKLLLLGFFHVCKNIHGL